MCAYMCTDVRAAMCGDMHASMCADMQYLGVILVLNFSGCQELGFDPDWRYLHLDINLDCLCA